MSYLWLNRFIPAAYTASLENLNSWSPSSPENESEKEDIATRAMEGFNGVEFAKACKEFEASLHALRAYSTPDQRRSAALRKGDESQLPTQEVAAMLETLGIHKDATKRVIHFA